MDFTPIDLPADANSPVHLALSVANLGRGAPALLSRVVPDAATCEATLAAIPIANDAGGDNSLFASATKSGVAMPVTSNFSVDDEVPAVALDAQIQELAIIDPDVPSDTVLALPVSAHRGSAALLAAEAMEANSAHAPTTPSHRRSARPREPRLGHSH